MPKNFNGNPAIILLVEDNDADVRLTQEALLDGKINNQIHRVENGIDALAFLRHEAPYEDSPRPDIILLDLNMPRMDGRELLKIINDDPALSIIPVIVLTTSEAEQDISKSYALRANCYISKPVDYQNFTEVVRSIEQFWFSIVRLPEPN
ncbi:MAG: response regulator [Gammaproteobacteria bacterium]|nr:response regulator [Gammaproteobacteria bacterium]